MRKKGLAINTIIVFTIALIALVIVSIILARGSGSYIKSTSCESGGGKCVNLAECYGEGVFLSGCGENEVCCITEGG